MALYLAFDVGGTKTAAVLADESQVLARAEAGSIKTLRIGAGEARANLEAVLVKLVGETGVDLRQVKRTCIGTSGNHAPAVRDWLRAAIAETVGPCELVLVGDEVIAVDGFMPGARAVLVIAGTGSNVVGRARHGQMAHTGGWGPFLADQGSGHAIGHGALRACFRAIDQAAASSADYVASGVPGQVPAFFAEPRLEDLPALLQRTLKALGMEDLDSLIGAANAPEFNPAKLVPVVREAALAGDEIALGVLREAGEDLAELVLHVIAKVEGLEGGAAPFEAPPVGWIGGVLAHIPEVRMRMAEVLRGKYPEIVVAGEAADALRGALWHARGRPLVVG